jgi:hypothetical protein
MYRKVLLFITFFMATGLLWAQKVKYKDLIELLNAKQYEMAEPHLKRYLKEETDNASAYLYMGITYQEKSLKNDILRETELLLTNLDSAIYFYNIAHPMITEKEIKKNGENYQIFNRRDVRTGEFGVKHSDVQLQIETRTKALKERRDNVFNCKKSFLLAGAQYKRTQQFFKNIQAQFESEKELLLRANDQLLVEFNNLALVFDSSKLSFASYKTLLQAGGKSNYNQEATYQPIKDFKKDGLTEADFYQNDLKLWNYGEWATQMRDKVLKEIVPLRESLIKADIEVNKYFEQVKKDSSVAKALPELARHVSFPQLTAIDPDPMPLTVFRVKLAELAYLSKQIDDKPLRDSSDVSLKMKALRTDITSAIRLDSLAALMMARNLENDARNYLHFINNSYGSLTVLKSWMKGVKEFAAREVTQREVDWEKTVQSLKWVFAGNDSIPLFMDDNSPSPYKPLALGNDQLTMGLKYADTLATGYFFSILPSRVPDMSITFPVDNAHFKLRNLPVIKGLLTHDSNQVYYAVIYLESKLEDGYPVTIARINRAGGLVWSNNYKFEAKPSELKYSPITGELTFKAASGEDVKVIAIDQNGKRLQ